jgi:LacI family transcriptional regulator
MRELDYRPNTLASGLRSGKTKTIGLIVPDISNQFFAEVSRKIEDNGFENGYSVILCNSDDDWKKEKNYIDVLVAKQVDGIIFISAGEESENLNKALEFDLPIVLVDRDIRNVNVDIVLVDNKSGGFNATQYLIELGHNRIGCIAGPSPVTPSAMRVEGFKQALQEAKLAVDPALILPGDYRFSSGEKVMRSLLMNPSPPTAVFASNDMMALGAIKAIHENGLKIPEDISVIGFDNIPLSQATYPSLTTISQPIQEMAALVVNLLVERMKFQDQRVKLLEEEPDFRRVVLQTELIVRNSCREI